MNTSILRLLGVLAVSTLSACAAPKTEEPPPPAVVPGYEGVEDGGFYIEPVAAELLSADRARKEVDYTADDKPGTIVVDTFARKLYLVQENGRALRYAIAVGREGLSFRGSGVIGRKEKWPSWQPTANMVRTRPDLYAEYAGGLAGGLDNPLGARAMYLYRNGRDSMFRIHGTNEPWSIGRAASSGCIRMTNEDVIDLYNKVKMGAIVVVLITMVAALTLLPAVLRLLGRTRTPLGLKAIAQDLDVRIVETAPGNRHAFRAPHFLAVIVDEQHAVEAVQLRQPVRDADARGLAPGAEQQVVGVQAAEPGGGLGQQRGRDQLPVAVRLVRGASRRSQMLAGG